MKRRSKLAAGLLAGALTFATPAMAENWYILSPPRDPVTDKAQSDKPYSEWDVETDVKTEPERELVYRSQAECEQARQQVVKKQMNELKNPGDNRVVTFLLQNGSEDEIQAYITNVKSRRCVSESQRKTDTGDHPN